MNLKLQQLYAALNLLVCNYGEDGECESCNNDAECTRLAESIISEFEAIRMSGDIEDLDDLLEEA